MNTTIKSCLIFAAGAVVGALGMRYYIHKQLENAEYEDSDYEALTTEDNTQQKKEPTIAEYAAMLAEKHNYVDYTAFSANEPKKTEETEKVEEEPHQIIIDYDSWGQTDGYEPYSYTYYADGVLEDDNGDQMTEEEIVRTVGWKALALFDNPNTWSVYVRNDKLKAEYEICRDKRNYFDMKAPRTEVVSDEDGD